MGKIVKDKFPELEEHDQEAIRQHAVASLNLTQKAKEISKINISSKDSPSSNTNTALLSGVKKFVTDVSDLNIDLIDSINPFGEAYSILSKTMNEESLRKIHEIISSKRVSFSIEEARDLAKRALKFKKEMGRVPSITSSDPWEKRMAEGVAFLKRTIEGESK